MQKIQGLREKFESYCNNHPALIHNPTYFIAYKNGVNKVITELLRHLNEASLTTAGDFSIHINEFVEQLKGTPEYAEIIRPRKKDGSELVENWFEGKYLPIFAKTKELPSPQYVSVIFSFYLNGCIKFLESIQTFMKDQRGLTIYEFLKSNGSWSKN